MVRKYNYRSVKKISKKGILFHDGFFVDFELCRSNFAEKHNIHMDEVTCVAERDITARDPYFLFFVDSGVVVYFKKDIFGRWDKHFHDLYFGIIELGYSTFDLS